MPKVKEKVFKEAMKAMREHPDQVNMDSWYSSYLPVLGFEEPGGCGTAGCIAGWFAFIAMKKKKRVTTLAEARKLVDDNQSETIWSEQAEAIAREAAGLTSKQAYRLFLDYNWTWQGQKEIYRARTPKEYTEAVIGEMERFLEEVKGE